MSDLRLIYITASSSDEAATIARTLVAERLAACANVIDGARSFYWWEGAVQDEREALIVAKTLEHCVSALTARVRELHSYTVPCVVALPILDGNADYLSWLRAQVG
ncbi:MAG: divalent-cation tolerance protein CutA [Myxococcales bacterium]|nr:divalent-cation tolerance protein CutA [Myxococcales bacterium]